ncbi:HK97 family phage prohead protease [Moraxella bovis]|uniref:HK97 family phage prohead protease n=1 Tax=Moraxella bovis TaxID=476 RepID=UPI002226C343|nr:HK97 family phage prohead protease [Moraxella bovis]UZA13267.1 HK97 family phage prohead protease [Moraxella bovis]UZA37089.1 HK97 family phage prohead protease [Moraxella bovis]
MTKAYSTLAIKSVTETDDERIITGIATTPSTDRDDDILEPTGAKFALPIPLLWQHNHNQPIGEVISATVTDKGIEIVAKIAKITDDGKLKDRIDEAWQSIKSGLVKCLSVGFKIKEYNYLESSWGLHIKEWEWYELSVVTVPANSDAVITSVKQIKDAFSLPLQPTPNPPISPINPPPTQTKTQKSNQSDGSVALILSNNGVSLL